MPESPEEWYRSLPKVTRGWLTLSFATTVAVQLELLSPMALHLSFEHLTHKFELWRLLTNFCFFGKFGFPFVFALFFLIRYSRELEAKRFEGRTADFVWAMLFMGAVQVTVALLLGGLPFMANSMLSAVVYLWSREYAEQVLSIFGLFNVQAFYFPWVRDETSRKEHLPPPLPRKETHETLPNRDAPHRGRDALSQSARRARPPPPPLPLLVPRRGPNRDPPLTQVLVAMRVLMGGSPVDDLIGIFAGHIYYFLEDVQNVQIRAPQLLVDALDGATPGRAQPNHRGMFGGHAWGGGGQRLGG